MRAWRRTVQVGLVLVLAAGTVVGAAGPARAEPTCVDTSEYIAEGYNGVCVDVVNGQVQVSLQPFVGPIEYVFLPVSPAGESGAELTLSNGSTVRVVGAKDGMGVQLMVCLNIVVRDPIISDCITL